MAHQKLQVVKPDLLRDTHLMVVHGSRAYGMHTHESDVDIKGFMMPPIAARFATYKPLEQVDGKAADMMEMLGDEPMMVFYDLFNQDERDCIDREKLEGTIYEFSKFIMLLAKMNPSMIDILYCRDDEVRISTEIGDYVRSVRGKFLSQMARGSYIGYAEDQMRKLKTHRGWLLHPPESHPTREEYGLPSKKDMPRDKVNAIRKLVENHVEEENCSEEEAYAIIGLREAMSLFTREKQYQNKRTEWKSYQHWKKHRNRERAKLETIKGYDLKHASHLYRLMKMGYEIVSTGEVNVWRDDAEEILAIRGGAWEYEDLHSWFTKARDEIKNLDMSQSPLPEKPDSAALDEVFATTFRMKYGFDPRERD